jgi:hypothetical protein
MLEGTGSPIQCSKSIIPKSLNKELPAKKNLKKEGQKIRLFSVLLTIISFRKTNQIKNYEIIIGIYLVNMKRQKSFLWESEVS